MRRVVLVADKYSRENEPRVPLWNIANILTLVRVALVPVFAIAMLMDSGQAPTWRLIAAAVFAAAAITDRFDGQLARNRGLVTDFGKIVDPIADKALIGTALICLSYLDFLPWWVTLLILTREFGITALRLIVVRRGVIPASAGGKLKTVVQIFAIGLYIMPLEFVADWLVWVAHGFMGLAILLTVGTGIHYVVQATAQKRRANAQRQ